MFAAVSFLSNSLIYQVVNAHSHGCKWNIGKGNYLLSIINTKFNDFIMLINAFCNYSSGQKECIYIRFLQLFFILVSGTIDLQS
jgi:hypothetical protein